MTARKIGILGAGSWGTALAIQAARTGCEVLLWGHHQQHMEVLAGDRENKHYLPGAAFPANLSVTADLREVGGFSDLLLIAVPSHAFKATLAQLKPFAAHNIKIAWATKGFNPDDGSLLHELVTSLFSAETQVAVLSGPTFAHEVAAELPTAITIASPQDSFSNELTHLFHSNRFRTYTSTDIVGVEVGGAVKNVMAIAAGIADGLGFGANTRAALITRGLTEIIRLGLRLGGHQETFMGLAGLGDLILTCTDNQSRNRRLGIALGRGQALEPAMREIGQEVEGVLAARETYQLAKKHGIDMPITEQTFKVLYEGLSPVAAVQNLLSRELKSESTGP
ncbi:NAD(P)H-dependent glycerol-3-phosphate dehydrogenase [Methylomicrobium lacus]|uniref:NAD(P)H-dependent glycerol-3-phosphate dehydrogenase n=1 Tax=Methylomicrobium lacus TaxID=136992 RepID=UPI00045E729A|nr:NAD(P)H-dependent glycerol-3-phosphate dehydrogenase [Methylomicrobium lacus]